MTFRLAMAQINPVAGDLERNTGLILDGISKAAQMGADLAVFPELSVSGYPPEDLLLRPSFIRRCREALERIAAQTRGTAAIVGAPVAHGGSLKNAAAILAGGKVAGFIAKTELPNYGVFDEKRYFTPGANGPLISIGSALVGVTICEDIWTSDAITARQAADGANLLVNISASPYREGALEARMRLVSQTARRHKIAFAYCNITGGQDELIFDGRSFVTGQDGSQTAAMAAFEEDFLLVDIPGLSPGGSAGREVIAITSGSASKPPIAEKPRAPIAGPDEEVYMALALGVKDYIGKNRFPGAIVALSGGIDSALTCAIAVDALGPQRVMGLLMPSPFSSRGSVDDAAKLAANLGIKTATLPIGEAMETYDRILSDVFRGRPKDVAEENIQARIRGNLVMAISNKTGMLALTTGNKSETAMGYCTLYGDMAGGLAVIKDVYKMKVYALSRWRNQKAGRDLIPRESIEKEPSAELRPGQKDTDSLPPYDVLDPILRDYIEGGLDADQIAAKGADPALVARIIRMVDMNEYKRRQGPIGLKITEKAFGRDRRLPITCRY